MFEIIDKATVLFLKPKEEEETQNRAAAAAALAAEQARCDRVSVDIKGDPAFSFNSYLFIEADYSTFL